MPVDPAANIVSFHDPNLALPDVVDDASSMQHELLSSCHRRGVERRLIFGLSKSTGEVLWRDRGSSFNCNLPNDEYAVRCRTSGRSIHEHDAVSFEQLDTTVEGFDPLTGKTTWSVAVGATERLRYPNRLPIAGKNEVVIDAREGTIVLDYANGNVRTPAAGATFWCMTTMKYHFSYPYRLRDGSTSFSRPGGIVFSICDDRGRPGTTVPDRAATIAAGAQIGNYIMITMKNGYIGFHTR